MSSTPVKPLPRWIDVGVIPVLNIVMALLVSGLIIGGWLREGRR